MRELERDRRGRYPVYRGRVELVLAGEKPDEVPHEIPH